jgi:hypothetical protein
MVTSISQPTIPPSLEIFPVVPAKPVSVESLEDLMRELYETISEGDRRGLSYSSFAVKAERAWNEALSQKLEEEQARLRAHISTDGTISKVSAVVAPLCLAAEGVFSLVTEGIGGRGIAAIALGGLLAVDALCDALTDHSAKKYLAKALQRTTNESEQAWLERISTTCALASVALGVSLPGTTTAKLATTISQGVLDCTHAGTQFSIENERALIIELEYSMETSSRNMQFLSRGVAQWQDSSTDQLGLLSQLQRSNIATTDSIFS